MTVSVSSLYLHGLNIESVGFVRLIYCWCGANLTIPNGSWPMLAFRDFCFFIFLVDEEEETWRGIIFSACGDRCTCGVWEKRLGATESR